MSAATQPDSPAPFSSVTAAKMTPAVNAVISGAHDLPTLVNGFQVVAPDLAKQIEGTTLAKDPSALGTLIGLGIGWAIPHYGLACSAVSAAVAGCWTPDTINFATGAGCIIGTAAGAYIMRMFATSPIAGVFTKGATLLEQWMAAQKAPGAVQAASAAITPQPAPIPVAAVGSVG